MSAYCVQPASLSDLVVKCYNGDALIDFHVHKVMLMKTGNAVSTCVGVHDSNTPAHNRHVYIAALLYGTCDGSRHLRLLSRILSDEPALPDVTLPANAALSFESISAFFTVVYAAAPMEKMKTMDCFVLLPAAKYFLSHFIIDLAQTHLLHVTHSSKYTDMDKFCLGNSNIVRLSLRGTAQFILCMICMCR